MLPSSTVMNFSAVRFLSHRYLWSRRRSGVVSLTALFAFLGIALGVGTLIVTLSVMDGFRVTFLAKVLSYQGHASLHAFHGDGLKDYERLRQTILDNHRGQVKAVTPLIEKQGLFLRQDAAQGVMLYGLNVTRDAFRIPPLMSGTLEGLAEEGSVVIGRVLARKLGVTVGDEVTWMVSMGEETALGTLPLMQTLKVVGIFDAGHYLYDGGVCFLSLESMQETFNMGPTVNTLDIFLYEPQAVEAFHHGLSVEIKGRGVWTDWQRSNQTYMSALRTERNVMFLLLSLIVVIASFNILTGMTFLVKDKAKDIAFLRSIGTSRFFVGMIFYRMALMLGGAGIVLGILWGSWFTLHLEDVRQFLERLWGVQMFHEELYYFSQLPAVFSWDNVFQIAWLTLSWVLVAAIYPAWKASSLKPLSVLRYGS